MRAFAQHDQRSSPTSASLLYSRMVRRRLRSTFAMLSLRGGKRLSLCTSQHTLHSPFSDQSNSSSTWAWSSAAKLAEVEGLMIRRSCISSERGTSMLGWDDLLPAILWGITIPYVNGPEDLRSCRNRITQTIPRAQIRFHVRMALCNSNS